MAVPFLGGYQATQAGKPGGKKNAPAPPDFMKLAQQQSDASQRMVDQQTAANRPNQSTPFASSQWTRGPDGQWSQQVGLSGPLGQAASNAQLSAAEMMRQPLDYSGLQAMTSGEDARKQATDAAYGQATSRLDPMWQQREEANRTRLLNQGLTEGSAAWERAMGNMGRERTDAYNQAMYGAIGQGGQAGQQIFNQNLAARQQGMAELLRKRQQPMEELQALQGLTAMPGFSQAGAGQAPNLLGAGQAGYQADYQAWQQKNQQMMDIINSLAQLGMTGAQLSDERAKEEIVRSDLEVFPGVPVATWKWRPEFEGSGPTQGVIAQDLQRVLPGAVSEGPNGYLMVDYRRVREAL